jgi:hypothetical protein
VSKGWSLYYFIAGLVYGLFNIGFNFIYPDFINEMASITKEGMLKQTPNITRRNGIGLA